MSDQTLYRFGPNHRHTWRDNVCTECKGTPIGEYVHDLVLVPVEIDYAAAWDAFVANENHEPKDCACRCTHDTEWAIQCAVYAALGRPPMSNRAESRVTPNNQCVKCHYGEQHPFHDSGEPNWVDFWLWEKEPPVSKVSALGMWQEELERRERND